MAVPLPPLPTTGDEESYLPTGASMVDLLAEEHTQFDRLSAELTATTDPQRRRQVIDVLTAMVARHLSAEEQYLYPTVRMALPGGDQLAEREIEADREILRALRDLARETPGDATAEAGGTAAATHSTIAETGATPEAGDTNSGTDAVPAEHRVSQGLRRHARALGEEVFPALRDIASEAELIRLGNRVQIAKEAAPTRPHPGTPSTPPWNLVAEPAIGVVDKIRDVVSGRRTYLDDLGGLPRR